MSRALLEPDALLGVTVAFSVSDSVDLAQLGLARRHCDLVVAELTRAITTAGGQLLYGGRLDPPGFTQIMIDEVLSHSGGHPALILCVPASEWFHLPAVTLCKLDDSLGNAGRLALLNEAGDKVAKSEWANWSSDSRRNPSTSLTSMRSYVSQRATARVVVGGKLKGYHGSMPGIIEEALLSAEGGRPLYVAGGFGGAAAALAKTLGYDNLSWGPPGFPAGANDGSVRRQLDELAAIVRNRPAADGLDPEERQLLASSHRPGDIATLVVLGLSRVASAPGPIASEGGS